MTFPRAGAVLIACGFFLVPPMALADPAGGVGCDYSNNFACPSGETCNSGTCVTIPGTGSSVNGGGSGTTGTNTGGSLSTTGTNTGGSLLNPLGATSLWGLVGDMFTFVIRIGAVVIVFMLVYVGFQFVTARGEPAKLTTARNALLWTIVGALVLLGAKAISIGICETAASLSTTSVISCPIF